VQLSLNKNQAHKKNQAASAIGTSSSSSLLLLNG